MLQLYSGGFRASATNCPVLSVRAHPGRRRPVQPLRCCRWERSTSPKPKGRAWK